MTAKIRRTYAGAAVKTTLSVAVDDNDTSLVIAESTGWPTGYFYVVIDPGTTEEEKVLISSRAATTLTVSARGVDGTVAKNHAETAVIYPVATAVDFDEANELTSSYETTGGIVYKDAVSFTELPLGTQGYVVVAGASAPTYAQLTATAIGNNAVTTDKINASAVTTDKINNAAVTTDKLASNSVTTVKITDANVTTAKIADSNVTLGKLAAAVQELLVPAGTVSAYAGSSAPTGWLVCGGQNVSRTTYASLFAVIGTTYGVGDGTTTFALPDLRGRVIAGLDNLGGSAASRLTNTTITGGAVTIGNTGGNQTHQLTEAELAAHSHSADGDLTATPVGDHQHVNYGFNSGVASGTNGFGLGMLATTNGGYNYTSTAAGGHGHDITGNTSTTGSGTAHNNVQPTMVLNYIIKA